MKKTIISFIFLAFMMLGFTVQSQTLLLNEHFDYPVGDTIGSHGWAWHSGTSNFIGCVSGSLSYTGYPTSVGNMVFMNSSGEDANHSFTTQTAGSSIYVACLINVATASTTGDYFMHLKGASTTIFTGRIYIKKDATLNKFSIGLLKGSTAASTTYTSTLYDFATTHLIVLKYTIATGATNDSVSLFIDPSIANEGVPTIVASDLTSTDLDETSQAIALRQGTAANSLTLNVDEIRISNNWNVAIGFSGVVTAPAVLSVGANSITNTSAICSGNVSSDGGSAITKRGICYGTAANPDTTGTKTIETGTVGSFTSNLSGLTGGTLYHFRAYAVNSIGISYGADSTFTTATGAVAPIITTGTVTTITENTATVAGNVTNDGGSAILARGICYSTTANPDTTALHVSTTGTTGAYTCNLASLNPSTLYHVRAYAKNAVGVSYGADVTFTTAIAGVPVATIAALRSQTADNTTIYKLTGEAVLTFKQTNRNQKYIQDATAAILIDDNSAIFTTTYNIGDGISNIKGKLYNYFGYLEFVPVADPGVATSTANVVTPLVITAANILDTTFMYSNQAKLVKLNNIAFSDANGTMKFTTNKKYRMTDGTTNDSLFFTNFYSVDYMNAVIPSGSSWVVGIVNRSLNKYYITSRNKLDINLISGINETEANKFSIYPNPTSGKFSIVLDKAINAEIKIYAIDGRLILNKSSNKVINEFDISSYGKGMYFITITDKKTMNTSTEKIIIN